MEFSKGGGKQKETNVCVCVWAGGWVRVEHQMNGGRNLVILVDPFIMIMQEGKIGDVNLSLHRHISRSLAGRRRIDCTVSWRINGGPKRQLVQ